MQRSAPFWEYSYFQRSIVLPFLVNVEMSLPNGHCEGAIDFITGSLISEDSLVDYLFNDEIGSLYVACNRRICEIKVGRMLHFRSARRSESHIPPKFQFDEGGPKLGHIYCDESFDTIKSMRILHHGTIPEKCADRSGRA